MEHHSIKCNIISHNTWNQLNIELRDTELYFLYTKFQVELFKVENLGLSSNDSIIITSLEAVKATHNCGLECISDDMNRNTFKLYNKNNSLQVYPLRNTLFSLVMVYNNYMNQEKCTEMKNFNTDDLNLQTESWNDLIINYKYEMFHSYVVRAKGKEVKSMKELSFKENQTGFEYFSVSSDNDLFCRNNCILGNPNRNLHETTAVSMNYNPYSYYNLSASTENTVDIPEVSQTTSLQNGQSSEEGNSLSIISYVLCITIVCILLVLFMFYKTVERSFYIYAQHVNGQI